MTMVDPILLSVLRRRFKSITEEMGLTLLRTSRSPILSEARDFVTGLFAANGDMLEQTEYIPVLAFALQPVCKKIVEYFGDELYPGDVILHNDVYSGGNQLADIAIFKPVFFEGNLVAWAASKGHQADVGGAVAGGYNPQAREVWQEGLRIPPVKLYEHDQLRRDVWDFVFANIRLPIVQDDIRAEIGSCTVGARRMEELYTRYGRECIELHVQALYAATEKQMRAEIAAIPDGVYRGESTAFYDAVRDGSEMKIVVTVTKDSNEIHFDYTGTDPQTPGFVNAPLSTTISGLLLTFLMLIDPDIPHNAGLMRPIHVRVPEGCFLNPTYPAATTFGNSLTGPHSDALFRALSQALPERVTAGWNRMLACNIVGWDSRHERRFVDILFLSQKGGSGATQGVDGYDHIGLINCAGGILAQDYEMLEVQTPNFLLRHEYWPDSGGPGQWRGGLGVVTEMELGGNENTAIIYGDGTNEEARAFGLFGGMQGLSNRLELEFPDGRCIAPKLKDKIESIPPGSILRQWAGGGGGYGDPYARPVELVQAEVRNELLSIQCAERDYGVQIDGDHARRNGYR
ncbi:MAG: hydantoinase B/oxoprolinase family protein [Anaerolineales bacterium]|mgnify:CR=1|jgi:N-methylhydantoinase B|nr:hydantoinase B/oxoprolinase family protein [Anaerolineales bacterium]|tara:strand:+ start:15575 stop:17290 length:1716 start_codon:yes stop_codon:yes gene_type:complete